MLFTGSSLCLSFCLQTKRSKVAIRLATRPATNAAATVRGRRPFSGLGAMAQRCCIFCEAARHIFSAQVFIFHCPNGRRERHKCSDLRSLARDFLPGLCLAGLNPLCSAVLSHWQACQYGLTYCLAIELFRTLHPTIVLLSVFLSTASH